MSGPHLATTVNVTPVLHIVDDRNAAAARPPTRVASVVPVGVSLVVHGAALAMLLALGSTGVLLPPLRPPTVVPPPINVGRIVFIAREGLPVADGGGGGGGNHQAGPIRHAEGVGSDAMTLRTRRPQAQSAATSGIEPLPSVVLDARSLASGTFDQVGLPLGGVGYGTSTGPGSGGGVGTGVGTGIGPGVGPGIGSGSGGGIGGGPYRPGGAVSPPRALVEAKPIYTYDALANRIQGPVVLELVVTAEGLPSQIRVVQSLDSDLDHQAIAAAAKWRFAPGRLGGQPVDVLVTMVLNFSIR